MENNLSNKSAQSSQSNSANTSAQQNSTSNNNTASSSNAQGRTNQQATSGKDSMKNIQDKLQQYSGPIAQKISGLTTTQKVVGGSLLALGAGWLALSTSNKNKIKGKASDLTANARHKMHASKPDRSSGSNTNKSNTGRSGSSAIDARVK